MYEKNQEIIRKDRGYIVLYNRPNSPNWQTRIKLKGANDVKKSTGTKDKTQAHIYADNLYARLVAKYEATGTTETKTYSQVAKEWLMELETESDSETIDNFKENIHRHSLVFWENTPIDLINDKEIMKFVSWRKKKYKDLKDATLKRGFVPIKQLLTFAYKMGYIKEIPKFPKLNNIVNPRPDFNEDEWQAITHNVDDWIKISPLKSRRNRIYLKYYILIMGNTGIRPGTESRSLLWSNIDESRFKGYEYKQTVAYINEGKVGERITVPPIKVKILFDELKQYRKKECEKLNIPFNEDEPIFCNKHGEGIKSFKKGFTAFLQHYNLLTNKHNQRRTLYSLRHTYATRMNRQGKNLRSLAKNMGTSLLMLEKTYLHDEVEDFGAEFLHADTPRASNQLF